MARGAKYRLIAVYRPGYMGIHEVFPKKEEALARAEEFVRIYKPEPPAAFAAARDTGVGAYVLVEEFYRSGDHYTVAKWDNDFGKWKKTGGNPVHHEGDKPMPRKDLDLDMSSFFDAYLEAALFTSTDNSDPSGGEPLDRNYSKKDFTKKSIDKMSKDALKFATENAHLIEGKEERAGHDFWLTRNRHGAGFWDGDWPEPDATILTDSAHSFGEQNIEVYRKKLHVM